MASPERIARPDRPFRATSFETAAKQWWMNGWFALAFAIAAGLLAGEAAAATAWFCEYPKDHSWFTVLSITVSAAFMTLVMMLVLMALNRHRVRA